MNPILANKHSFYETEAKTSEVASTFCEQQVMPSIRHTKG